MESRTRFAVLGALAEAPASVYTIKQALAASVGHFWHESFGQLYPVLKQMASEGLVVLQEEGGPRDRKIYAITPKGLEALRTWLEDPSEYSPPPRNEFLLKLFFGGHAAPEVSLARLKRFADRNRSILAAYEGIEREIEANPSPSERQPYMSTTLFFGMASARSALAWSEEAIRFLERRDSPMRRETED
ncbi:Transcriptional regulator PadR-like family protein [compost metagenome]